MLAHFAGNVCKHIALAAEIDPEHRPRQNLGHGPFRHDLFFLRHRRGIYPRTVRPSTEPVAVSLCETLRVEVALRVAERRSYRKMSRLADVFERDAWQVFAEFLTFPPRASFAMFLGSRETIAIKSCANVARRSLRKRISFKKRCDFSFAMQQRNHRLNKPRILSIRPQRGEPHLPVEPRLMRRAPARRAHHVTGLPFEFVRLPIKSVSARFDHNLAPIFGHHAKKTVTVYNSKRLRSSVSGSEQA